MGKRTLAVVVLFVSTVHFESFSLQVTFFKNYLAEKKQIIYKRLVAY